jgi:hypothetical protein
MFTNRSHSRTGALVPRLTSEQLRRFALDALEEAVAQAEQGPVRRTWALRLALAYLASLHPRIWSSGNPYRDFWRALSIERRAMRLSALEGALRIIYVRTDSKRDDDRASAIREQVRQLGLDGQRQYRLDA